MSFAKELGWKWNGKLISEGVKAVISIGDEFDIKDCNKQKIASLEEEIFDTIGHVVSRYKIKDAQGRTVAYSERVQWVFTTHFTIMSEDGNHILVTIRRPVFSWGDQWWIDRNTEGTTPGDQLAQDPRVLVMLAAFNTAHGSSATKWVIWSFMILIPLAIIGCCCAFIYIGVNGENRGEAPWQHDYQAVAVNDNPPPYRYQNQEAYVAQVREAFHFARN